MIRAAAAVVAVVASMALAGCNGSAERATATEPATTDVAPVVTAERPGPPPARDCTLLRPAIERITAAEIVEIKRTRPANVAPIVEAEVTSAGALLADVLPRLCEADAWSGAYTACVDLAKVRDDARACSVHLTAEQQVHLETEMKNGKVAGSRFGVPECDEWEAIVVRLQTCDKFPQASRDALKQAIDQAMTQWATQIAASPETRVQIAIACKQAVEQMRQSLVSMGCPP